MADRHKSTTDILNGDGRSIRTVPITWSEFVTHDHKDSLWILVEGKVYDVTNFKKHPGSFEKLLQHAAMDGTSGFKVVGHKPGSIKLMDNFYIGQIDPETVVQYEALPAPTQPDRYLYIAYMVAAFVFFYSVAFFGA